jgi:hypothetical protein
MMTGEIDTDDFTLAENLRMSLSAVRAMPNTEWVEWRAYYVARAANADLEARHGR